MIYKSCHLSLGVTVCCRFLWIHAHACTHTTRLMSDCGRLQESELVLFTGLGLARVKNVVSVRSIVDLESILGRSLDSLGLEVPRHRRGVEVLCETCNMSRRLIDLGHLVLLNVELLSHGLPWYINSFTNTSLPTFPRRHTHTHIHAEWKSVQLTLHVLVY